MSSVILHCTHKELADGDKVHIVTENSSVVEALSAIPADSGRQYKVKARITYVLDALLGMGWDLVTSNATSTSPWGENTAVTGHYSWTLIRRSASAPPYDTKY